LNGTLLPIPATVQEKKKSPKSLPTRLAAKGESDTALTHNHIH